MQPIQLWTGKAEPVFAIVNFSRVKLKDGN